MTLDLHAVQANAIQIAREAGAIIMEFYEGPLTQSTKSSAVDMVTEADKESEALIVQRLTELYRDHHIVGEEGGGYGPSIEAAEYRWYIDPVDGTTNFASGLPYFAVSMALTDATMTPLMGVVFCPIADEVFTAIRGEGATLNGEPIKVSNDTTLETSVLGTGFPYNKATALDNNSTEWGEFLIRSRGVRRFGSAAMDMCFVACGRFDGFWEQQLNPWDCLAAVCCVLEAGGHVTDYEGNESSEIFGKGKLVVTNGKIHDEMLEVLTFARSRIGVPYA